MATAATTASPSTGRECRRPRSPHRGMTGAGRLDLGGGHLEPRTLIISLPAGDPGSRPRRGGRRPRSGTSCRRMRFAVSEAGRYSAITESDCAWNLSGLTGGSGPRRCPATPPAASPRNGRPADGVQPRPRRRRSTPAPAVHWCRTAVSQGDPGAPVTVSATLGVTGWRTT